MQDPIRCWERKKIVINNGSSADSCVATRSPTAASRKIRPPVAPDTFDTAIYRNALDYRVFEDDKVEDVFLGNNDDDDSDDDFVDDEKKEKVQPVKLTPEQKRGRQIPPVLLFN